jgi:hypothetical protein
MRELVRLGDRFRTTRDTTLVASFTQYAPAHTVGGPVEVPAGTVIVAFDQRPGSTAFTGYPEAYDEMELVLVPESERTSPGYAGGYALTIYVQDVGDALEPMTPLKPRPTENRLPSLSRLRERS